MSPPSSAHRAWLLWHTPHLTLSSSCPQPQNHWCVVHLFSCLLSRMFCKGNLAKPLKTGLFYLAQFPWGPCCHGYPLCTPSDSWVVFHGVCTSLFAQLLIHGWQPGTFQFWIANRLLWTSSSKFLHECRSLFLWNERVKGEFPEPCAKFFLLCSSHCAHLGLFGTSTVH
jgi:hypothetical protein